MTELPNSLLLNSSDEHPNAIQKGLEQWFQCALGRSLLANQRLAIEKAMRQCFGFHQAEIGISHRIPVGNASNLGHKFYVLPNWQSDLPENCVISGSDEIGIDHDVADLVIMHHTLDYSAEPHQALREASRILKPSGKLIVVGFNPISTWGLRRRLWRSTQAPWNGNFISGNRVEDWLTLLDFKVKGLRYHFYTLPFNRMHLIDRFNGLENILNSKVPLGAYYVVLAQKQVGARISVKPAWRRKNKVIGMPLTNRIKSKHSENLSRYK